MKADPDFISIKQTLEGLFKATSPCSCVRRQSGVAQLSAAAGSFHETGEDFILSPREHCRPPPIFLHMQTFTAPLS